MARMRDVCDNENSQGLTFETALISCGALVYLPKIVKENLSHAKKRK